MPTAIVAYLTLFAAVGFLFVLASLLLGKLLRIYAPGGQKTEPYECGEPPVGPGSVQFDLRFYVVALVFLIFEVEVALFFPPATVFGMASHWRAGPLQQIPAARVSDAPPAQTIAARQGRTRQPLQLSLTPPSAQKLALLSMLDLGVFFVILLVGFAYVWSQGDLDWVRAVHHPQRGAEIAAMRNTALELRP